MINKNLVLIFLFLFSLLPNYLSGQIDALSDSWRWVHYTTQSGLPSNRVFDVVETSSGITWAVTQSGLAWYNGYYWLTIGEKHGLPERIVTSIVPANGDSLFVLVDGDLYYGGIRGFHPFNLVQYNHKIKAVNTIVPFTSETFLLLSDSSLYILQKNSITPFILPAELGKTKILHLWSSRGNYVWLNTTNGLYRWENNKWSMKLRATTIPIYLQTIKENKNGSGLTFMSSPQQNFGLWTWNEKGNMVHLKSEGIGNLITYDITPDNDVIVVRETEEVRIRKNGYWHSLLSAPEQLQMVIFTKYEENGNLWVGTERGLYLNRANSKRWIDWRFPSPDQRNSVNAIIQRKDGTVWLATGGGLVIHHRDGRIETITEILGNQVQSLTGLEEDNDGNVWISSGSLFEGAFRWNGKNWRYFGLEDGLDAGTIHKIKKDNQGRLWFLGLFRPTFEARHVDREPGAFVYSHGKFVNLGMKEGLLNGRVLAFGEEKNGTLWFGTNVGLSRRSPDGTWKHWTTDNGLKLNRIFTIVIDKQNKLWFGDQVYGLGYIENDTPKYFTTPNGLISNAVWDIQVDENNKLWIATRGGVSVYDNGVWSKLDLNDGFENIRIWPIQLQKNKVYFGTNGGGVKILNLDVIKTEIPLVIYSPPVIKGNSVQLHYEAFAYWNEQVSEDIEIRYRMDVGPWSTWTREREIIQTGLPSDEHVFEIQSKGLLGNYGTQTQKISFIIEPPLFRQPRFFIPIGILTFGLLAMGFIYLQRKRKQEIILKKSEIRYRNLFESANDAIMIIEPRHAIILEVNPKACETYGFSKEELIGMNLKNLTKDVEQVEEYVRDLIQKHRREVFEMIHLTKDRKEINIIANATIIDYDGTEAILTINRDVTEQMLVAAKLRLLAQTIADTQDYVCITDLENNILFVNDSFAKAYGYSNQELFGKNISIVRSPLTSDEIADLILPATIAGGWNGEVYNRRKDGTDFLIELWSSLVYNEEGKPIATVGVARDITERKQAEEENVKLIKELKDALAEVKTLTGLLPICSSCKKIRDDQGYWTQVDTYIGKHSGATFTHGLCPDCMQQYFPEVYKRMKDKNR